MSTIDEKIVSLKFKGDQFAAGVKTSTAYMDQLKKSLNMDGATKGLDELDKASKRFSLEGLGLGVDQISGKFIALATVGITALANITNKAVNTGSALVKSLTLDPVMQGFAEYELKMGSIQTILANTARHGTSLEQVTASLDDLNKYADETIYNFGDMTKNIGLFTNAGIKVEDATSMIKGFSNAAAASGTSAQGAAGAAYQLSQALSAGTIRLMDWRSLQNVGMGNKNMQQGLIEIASAMGTVTSAGLTSADLLSGDFNSSLEKGWLSADVMSNYLKIMAGDMDEASMAALGLSSAQITAFQEQQKTAQEAATKVRTWTQLIGTLQEGVGSGWAQTFDILFGDFNEATDLFTGIYDAINPIIDGMSTARNNLLQGWSDLGGRAALIEAIVSAFQSLMAILKPIGEAFQEIFPPTTAQTLLDMTNSFRDFIKSLAPGEDMLNNIKRTAKGLFAVLDIGWTVIKGLVSIIAKMFGATSGAAGGILEITGTFGDFLVSLRDAIKAGDGFNKTMEVLGNILALPVEAIKTLVLLLAGVVGGFKDASGTDFPNVLDSISQRLSGLSGIGEGIIKVWDKIASALGAVYNFIKPLLDKIGEAFSTLGPALSDAFSNVDFSTVLDAVNTGFLGGLLLLIKKFIDQGIGIDLTGGLKENIKEIFGSLTDTMAAMQAQIKAETLMKIAKAIALLTISVLALSLIDPVKLTTSLAAMTVMFAQLSGGLAILQNTLNPKAIIALNGAASAIILISIALILLSTALVILSTLDPIELTTGLAGLAVILLTVVMAVDRLSTMSAKIGGVSAALILFATAINILALAVRSMGSMGWGDLVKGLLGLAGVLGMIILVTNNIGSPDKIIATSFALILLGTALNIMAAALGTIGAMPLEQLGQGLLGIAATLAILVVALDAMPKNMAGSAAALLLVAAAVNGIAMALTTFGSMSLEQIILGLVGLAGSLAILAGALAIMTNSVAGSAALLIAAVALTMIAPVLQTLGSMSLEQIGASLLALSVGLLAIGIGVNLMTGAISGAAALLIVAVALGMLVPVLVTLGALPIEVIVTGLASLAAMFAIIGVAGLLLTPVVPTLLGLGVAISLLGVGAMLAGTGIMLLSAGLAALAVSGAAGGAALVAVITGLLGLIPEVFAQIAAGIVAAASVIAEGAPAIVEALVAILMALIEAINTVIPAAVEMIMNLIMALVDALLQNVPQMVDSGLQLIQGILTGIANNIQGIVEAAANIVINFINGISNSLPGIIDAGINLIISFVQGLADGIRNNSQKMTDAGLDLAKAIIDGIVNGIGAGVQAVIDAALNLANNFLSGLGNFLGIHSPSRETYAMGKFLDQGLANGITQFSGIVEDSADDLGGSVLDSLSSSMSALSSMLDDNIDYDPTIRPVMDLTQIRKDASALDGMIGNQNITSGSALDQARSIVNGQEALAASISESGDSKSKAPTVVNFTQNNNSPKALDAVEIYRRTKNQVTAVKEVLSADPHEIAQL